MPLSLRIGPAEHVEPVRAGAEGHPDLLPVDDPMPGFQPGLGPDRGQVGASVGLAEALPPHLLGRQDLRQEPALLLLGAEPEQRRAEQVLSLNADPVRCLSARVFVLEDDRLRQRRAPAAVLLRPGQPEPPPRRQLLFPAQPHVPRRRVVRTAHAAVPGKLADQVLAEPAADFVPERAVFLGDLDVHRVPSATARAGWPADPGGRPGCRTSPRRSSPA